MEVKKLSKEEYRNIFSSPYHAFNKVEFNLLNAAIKGKQIECLGFKNKKFKLGIIGSVDNGKFQSPFSAPFGGFSYTTEDVDLNTIEDAVENLQCYCDDHSISTIELTLPPFFYSTSFISKLSNVLFRKGFFADKTDLNYSICIEGSISDYIKKLDGNGRRNLGIASKQKFEFTKCESIEEKQLAYEIIKKNRAAKEYPLKMTFELMADTIQIIEADFFLLNLKGKSVAAAIVFHVAKGIVQVIYWGDLPEYSENKTMNYLSYCLVNYYRTQVKIIDAGPSTENSVPNYGLADFKESIGCIVHLKQSWKYIL